jgi:hypothetical protein
MMHLLGAIMSLSVRNRLDRRQHGAKKRVFAPSCEAGMVARMFNQ